jgi:hypothetical protein
MARRRPTEPVVNPARGAVLVVVAVLVGLLLLRNGLDTSEVITASKGDDSSDSSGDKAPDDTADTTPTTEAVRSPAEVTVIVLNGTSPTVNGAAGKYSTAIGSAGYQMLEPGDAPAKGPVTQIFFTEGFDQEAAAVALAAGAPATIIPAPMPTPPPGEVGAANVVVVIGNDLAGLTPTTIAPAATSTTAAT